MLWYVHNFNGIDSAELIRILQTQVIGIGVD